MANPYPSNGGPGFPRAPQPPAGPPGPPAAAGPALDALRRQVPGIASPAGGMSPNPLALTEGPQSNLLQPSQGTQQSTQMPPGFISRNQETAQLQDASKDLLNSPPAATSATNPDAWQGGVALPQLGLWGAAIQALQGASPSTQQVGLPTPPPATPPAEQPSPLAGYSRANTAIRGR